MEVLVEKINNNEFKVPVKSKQETIHFVRLSDDYFNQMTGSNRTKIDLIYYSFIFLLKSEPNTSILGSFELNVIETYFPDYKISVKKWIDDKENYRL